jgi:glycosyltransferase involved in cell wall biosynthesis
MSRFKLLIITNRYPAHNDDGASPFVADFVDGLKRNLVDCTVLTPFHRAKYYDDDNRVVRFHWGEDEHTIGSLPVVRPSSWKKIAAYFRGGYREAERLHKENDFDFCLALWAAPSGIFAHRLNRNYGLPYAVWCLGSDIHTYTKIPLVGNMILESLTASDRVYSDGHELGRMAERFSGCRYHFLPSMRKIGQEYISGECKRERLFVCPGRVEESKGVFDLLEAFQIIAEKHNSWSLYYIGDGSARNKLEEKIESCGLTGRVKTLGFLKTGEMYRLINLSSAVVIPTHRDSLPLTFGEAMQLKRPVIVTDVGDLGYFTEKFGVGLIVPRRSPEHLADTLAKFITDKKEYKTGFEECVEELDIDAAADRFTRWLQNHLSHCLTPKEKSFC